MIGVPTTDTGEIAMKEETALKLVEIAARLVIAGKKPTASHPEPDRKEEIEAWIDKLKIEIDGLTGSKPQNAT
ncbi:hypothetical protein [Jiella pacifica]|uniref:Uncharacterized protein n=1 Tax=Jiella pacifica TaxID=2696469 RepID=A0A6N9T1X2_9HYPH|nr:hypothetical protein [Jiella pacifica]NDW04036.1 hypothetical protein [Jiella pacifica]